MSINICRKSVLLAALTIIWMTVIFLFSAQNGEDSSGMSEKVRRRIHQSTGTRYEVPETENLDASYM